MTELKEGDKAPEFTLNDTNGNKVSLKDFIGKKVILYFYPKDDTPGCTIEACDFRDNLKSFTDTIILGVSLDNEASHQKFTKKFNLNFPLLCDTNATVSTSYGAYGKKQMMGREFKGIKRSTFIIDEEGKISKAIYNVKAKGHVEELKNA
jgi:thioredoxin-dependent peroxiredoxin